MSASIDLGSLVREIRESISVVKDSQAREEQKINHAWFIVHRSLALNPALDYMQPPSGPMADTDFYKELYMADWTMSSIFHRLVGYDHFDRAGSLGDVGKRARIMMLLLWINGHRLNKDKVRMLVSTVIEDGLRSQGGSDHIPSESEVTTLYYVDSVIKSLADMIKTRVPLPEDCSPFAGSYFQECDEDRDLSREDLWGYKLSEDQRYNFDVRSNPACLLRPCAKVIVPETKLSLLLIQWSVHNFGLGKTASRAEDIDPKAFWNGDPPPEVDPRKLKDCFNKVLCGRYLDDSRSLRHSYHHDNIYPASSAVNSIPLHADCSCGKCRRAIKDLTQNIFPFHICYFKYIEEQNCGALEKTWKPKLEEAERWFENHITTHVRTTSTPLFKFDRDVSLGPCILDAANLIDIQIGSQLSDDDLLRLIILMKAISIVYPVAEPSTSPASHGCHVSLPGEIKAQDLGYIVCVPRPGQEDENILFCKGRWLSDAFVDCTGITAIYPTQQNKDITQPPPQQSILIDVGMKVYKFARVQMFPFDEERVPFDRPVSSQSNVKREGCRHVPEPDYNEQGKMEIKLVLSECSKELLDMLIQITYLGRIIETNWLPSVTYGMRCQHKDRLGHTDYSILTFENLIQLVPKAAEDAAEANSSSLGNMNSLVGLTGPGCTMEQGRMVFVQCTSHLADAMVILAASVRKKVYVLNRFQCLACAEHDMDEKRCTVGIIRYPRRFVCRRCMN